jgi:L-alanine-DL-glutamate epimerase-like enolase superfamily enzyme
MKRRVFLKQLGVAGASGVLGSHLLANDQSATTVHPDLKAHKIRHVEFRRAGFHWPRLVGKNARLDVHGQNHSDQVVRLVTDQGAIGWGLSSGNAEALADSIQNKPVAQLIDPGTGLLDSAHAPFDFALHDLAGVILDQPVYQMLGAQGPRENLVYSGMIYFDELEPSEHPAGLAKVLENCQWDVDYGYRQLKVKIGRGNRWYSHDEGLKTDVEVVKRIQDQFGSRDVGILVDANDGYTLEDAIQFLTGIGDIPLFWFEEPFPEGSDTSGKLRGWMKANGFGKTLLADGEYNPDPALCMKLMEADILDVCLYDVRDCGFTRWRRLMPELIRCGAQASPHAWGSRLKTHYCAHLAAGLGNCCTIEGVTCESDDIDYGDYPIVDGKLRVSDAPGFGMKLLV